MKTPKTNEAPAVQQAKLLFTEEACVQAIADLEENLPMMPGATSKKCTLDVSTMRISIAAIKAQSELLFPTPTDFGTMLRAGKFGLAIDNLSLEEKP